MEHDDLVKRLRGEGMSIMQEAADVIEKQDERITKLLQEMIFVLAGWEEVFEMFDFEAGNLGRSKAVVVKENIERLQRDNEVQAGVLKFLGENLK